METDFKGCGAVISGKYRYALWRIWDENLPKVLFIMLNPSTADADEDDPTIRRCISFAKSWGYGGILVGNLFAFRSTNPEGLNSFLHPIGMFNGYYLGIMGRKAEMVICAWGHEKIVRYVNLEQRLKPITKPLHCLELSQNGIPKHPLYLKSNLKPIIYDTV